MGISAFDHPFLSRLVGDDEISRLLDAEAELQAMVDFEAELAEATAKYGIVPTESARAIKSALSTFSPNLDELGRGAARDGVVVPALVHQMREQWASSIPSTCISERPARMRLTLLLC